MTSFFFGNMKKIKHLNEKYPTVKFTAEWSQISINFLDVTVSFIGGIVTTDLYVKPTDKHQYLNLLHFTHITAKGNSIQLLHSCWIEKIQEKNKIKSLLTLLIIQFSKMLKKSWQIYIFYLSLMLLIKLFLQTCQEFALKMTGV